MRCLMVWLAMGASVFGSDGELFEELKGKVTGCGQYIVLAKKVDGGPFEWHTIPMRMTSSKVERFWRQARVLWRVHSREAFNEMCDSSVGVKVSGDDAFCNEDVIERQQVLDSNHMMVLYNYAPITDRHFLIVPKRHVVRFDELTPEEFAESMDLVRTILKVKESPFVYLFEKTGRDAGQTVPHAHMHLVMLESGASDIWSKMVMLKNMTIGASPLPPEAVKRTVEKYRNLFTSNNL